MKKAISLRLFCLFFVLTMTVMLLSAADCLAQKRLALLIGNSAYKNGPLKNPVNDVAAMDKSLSRVGFDVMVLKDADRATIGRAIDKFGSKLKNYDVGLFYFSGHGLQVNGINYLCPLGMNLQGQSDVPYEAIDAGKVLAKMEDAGNRMNVVILDACRNNPFKRSFRSGRNGLAQMDAPTGSFIAFATSPGRVAYDGKGRNSPYVTHMIGNMNKKGMTIEKFFKQVRRGVMKDTGKKQVPWESSSMVGDFYFAGKGSSGSSSSSQTSSQSSGSQQQQQYTPPPPPKPKKDKAGEVMDMLLN
ncbi:caspase family protein [Desulfovibrio sp. JC010]|uniref:caspase family protein n=1 Tax=Desulfovibrio sp. JC010 TaxID=2593641 RepID=UPI0013D2E905|nr:caspase family protein [Desulfovibrio sp. JC010]NDV25796.1 caspase family protein [Desulfovibrio sp. JC010]